MAKRKSISKKLRFDIFKRDSFTCQYCGKMAPDVVLEVDHINSVKNGGNNDMLNLITSCFDCNRGKKEHSLSENLELKKQQEQLKVLSYKREQLKLMIKWKKELMDFENEQVQILNDVLSEKTNYTLSETGFINFKKHVKKFGFDMVYNCLIECIEKYYIYSDSHTVFDAIEMVPRFCFTKSRDTKDPLLKYKYYIRGILKNRLDYFNQGVLFKILNDIMQDERDFDVISIIAKECTSWTDFTSDIEDTFY